MDHTKKKSLIVLKVQSKHRQVISSKFPKSLKAARDLVVFYEFLCDYLGFSDFQKFIKYHQVTSTPETLQKLAWNHLTVFWSNFENNLMFFFIFQGPTPNDKATLHVEIP